MCPEKLKIPVLLAESRIVSLTFEVVLEQYLHLMEDDGDLPANDVALSVRVQEVLCRRFSEPSDDLRLLAEKFGPHKIVRLFWPTLVAQIENEAALVFVPELVLDYLADHFRKCFDCYQLALSRVEKITGGTDIFRAFVSHCGV